MMHTDVLIIGGGMSGMCAAIAAGRTGKSVIILEKFDQIGKKLRATGNGRCNLMSLNPLKYFGDPDFAKRVMGLDPVRELTDFWMQSGLHLRYDPDGRGYPCTFMAGTVVDCLKAELRRVGVKSFTGKQVLSIRREKESGKSCFLVRTMDQEEFSCDRLIIATGGAAQPALGGNIDAFRWLEQMGHQLIPPAPALTPLLTDRRSISGLAGLRIKSRISVLKDRRIIHAETGELLFGEKGISGICVMQCARYVDPGKCECLIDLFPDIYESAEDLQKDLVMRQAEWPLESPTELLRGLCAPKLSYAICKQAELPLKGETIESLSSDQLLAIAETAKAYHVQIIGIEGFERAQVMAGGVDCQEVWPENLESRLVPGLHITGELLNVDGDCGGFNLMFAAISGLRAGKNERMDKNR